MNHKQALQEFEGNMLLVVSVTNRHNRPKRRVAKKRYFKWLGDSGRLAE